MRLLLLVLPLLVACTTPDDGFGGGDDDDSAGGQETDKLVGFVELADAPLGGASVRSISDPALATETDAGGRFELGYTDPADHEGLRFDHPDASLTDVWIDVAVPHAEGEDLFIQLLSPQRLLDFYAELGLELDGARTTVQVSASTSDGFDLPGVTVDLSAPYEAAFFPGESGPEPGNVTAEDPAGVVFANVESGPVQVTASHPDLSCIVPPQLLVEAATKVDIAVRCQ